MLVQLHALPVDVIKLDATLISSDADAWRTEALCRSVLAICEQMSFMWIRFRGDPAPDAHLSANA